MFYIFLILLLVFLSYYYDYRRETKNKSIWIYFLLFLFIIMAGLRYRMGYDTIVYERKFEYLPFLSQYFDFDYETYGQELTTFGRGFLFLGAFSKSILNEFFFLQLLQSTLVNTLIFFFFRKYSQSFFLSILIYFIISYFYFNFEIMRESCAVVIFLYSWQYYLKSKWIKYYLFCILAVLFHTGALLLFLLPLLKLPFLQSLFQINTRFIIFLGCFAFLCTLLYTRFFELFQYVNFLSIKEYGDLYANGKMSQSSNRSVIELLLYIILYCVIPIILVLYIKKYDTNPPYYSKDLETMICCYLLFNIASLFIALLFRFNNYFIPFLILLYSDILYSKFTFKKQKYKLTYNSWLIILVLILMPYIRSYFLGGNFKKYEMYYPYTSILFKEKIENREKQYNDTNLF